MEGGTASAGAGGVVGVGHMRGVEIGPSHGGEGLGLEFAGDESGHSWRLHGDEREGRGDGDEGKGVGEGAEGAQSGGGIAGAGAGVVEFAAMGAPSAPSHPHPTLSPSAIRRSPRRADRGWGSEGPFTGTFTGPFTDTSTGAFTGTWGGPFPGTAMLTGGREWTEMSGGEEVRCLNVGVWVFE